MTPHIRLGTRGSELALWQARLVQRLWLQAYPADTFELVIIRTEGDRRQDIPLQAFGGTGAFTKELERALLDDRIDLAVHSMKDVPTATASGLMLAAVPERGPVEDALIAREVDALDALPLGATVATGSLRRRAQLLFLRPDLRVVDLRGNVPTRLRKFKENAWDAMILAVAGMQRLGLANWIRAAIPVAQMLPAPGQGALYLQGRVGHPLAVRAAALDHEATHLAVAAERALMAGLEGGCRVPLGAWACVDGHFLTLDGLLAMPDGSQALRERLTGDLHQHSAEQIGEQLAIRLRGQGATAILQALRTSEAEKRA